MENKGFAKLALEQKNSCERNGSVNAQQAILYSKVARTEEFL